MGNRRGSLLSEADQNRSWRKYLWITLGVLAVVLLFYYLRGGDKDAPVVHGDGTGKVQLVTKDQNNQTLMIVDEKIPADCNFEQHADYDGLYLKWGQDYKVKSAAECCQACKDYKKDDNGRVCNVWVFCGDSSGRCWSPETRTYATGECWLKFQEAWDGSLDLLQTNLKVNARGHYSDEFIEKYGSPEMVQWTAGLLPP